MKQFGLRLENLREKYGYTKKELSLKLGFTPNVYGSYEREERRPSLETLVKLAEIYNVSLDYLIRGMEHTKEAKEEIKVVYEVLALFEENNIKHPYILALDKWKTLSEDDLIELTNHFEWVVEKRKRLNE